MTEAGEAQEVRDILARPSIALQAYGRVQSQEDEVEVPYDPYAITEKLQATLLGYIEDPPMDAEGFQRWLVVNKYRQAGASTTVAAAFYCKAQYTPGWEHITTADHQQRAEYLFQRVNYVHQRWPQDLKEPLISKGQVRSFHWEHSGKMLVRSGRGDGMGIGASASSWHWSEVPFWPDASRQWSYMLPAIQNRKKAMLVMESTPAPMSEASAEFYMELCENARQGDGRFIYCFEPFWDGKLNRRRWGKGDMLNNSEIRLLDQYGPYGLKKENIAFMRQVMDSDPEIKRNHELFRVFYPFDDMTCWMASGGGVIKAYHLERHLKSLVDFDFIKGYVEYTNPRREAQYVVCADPSGFGARDHAAFHVFEIWAGSWRQVACYATEADPPEFAERLNAIGRKFNNALVIVEANGVGAATLALLMSMEYPNLYWEAKDKPGLFKRSESQLLAGLIDALDDSMVLRDRDTVAQLRTYRSDRDLQKSVKAELLYSGNQGGRRSKHHWDKVSALMLLPPAVEHLSVQAAPEDVLDLSNVSMFRGTTVADIMRYEERVAEFGRKLERKRRSGLRRARYSSVRRKP